MKLYAIIFGCFRTTCVAASPERAVDEALYGTKPWYIDETALSTSIPPLLERQGCHVNEVEQRSYIKTLDDLLAKDKLDGSINKAVAILQYNVDANITREDLIKALEDIRTQALKGEETKKEIKTT